MDLPKGITEDEVLSADLEQLYGMLGKELMRRDKVPGGEKDPIRRAQAWLSAKIYGIKRAVCDPQIRETITAHETLAAIATLDGILASKTGGMPVTLVSAIILKSGLDNLCDGQ